MEPFKNLLSPALVRATGAHLQSAWPAFEAERFVARANRGLASLEMKARAMQIADALELHLPEEFSVACDVIERALAPAVLPGEPAPPPDAGLTGWVVWPLGEFVARRGLGDPTRALQCLHALTQRLSAEFAIRPLIVAHPRTCFATLARWTRDPSAHVRRLVSEGSRPRLPWGQRLPGLIADPSPTLPLLRALMDDTSAYVRRSVANHLNDIAKDHPEIVVRWVQEHLPSAGPERRALLAHGSRSLVKRGDPRMLAAWGHGERFQGEARLRLSARRATVGDRLRLAVRLRSRSKRTQRLVVDYAVHHVKANGRASPKVFKGWKSELEPGAVLDLAKDHSLRAVTTRRYYPGKHVVDVRVNGIVVAEAWFLLAVESGPALSARRRAGASRAGGRGGAVR